LAETSLRSNVSSSVTQGWISHGRTCTNKNGTGRRSRPYCRIGGGGFSVEPDNGLLDDFILSLSPRQPAKVCFVPTASADSATYLVKFYRAFSGRAIATDLTLFDPPALPRRPSRTSELGPFVAAQDIIYVGGGNTANLLAID
jgi:peptidase E